jgi:hypothetical protein
LDAEVGEVLDEQVEAKQGGGGSKGRQDALLQGYLLPAAGGEAAVGADVDGEHRQTDEVRQV